ncbi:MAG TPA: DcaP family trimeric outer membrane transporter, partial [Novosphingobium sp.]|nr:DcaP family trimeric outer membrane transporter [Novosphingobium sp.]
AAQAATAAQAAATAAATRSEDTATRVAAIEKAKPQGFRSGNSTVNVSGYVKLLMSSARYSGGDDATNSLGRDIYLPQFVPVYNPANPTSATRVTDFSAKQSRFWVDASTKVGSHTLKAYIEADFQAAPGTPQAAGQGTQRTTNAYDFAMRRAIIQLDRWTLGQEFTNFAPIAVFPESTDYVGGVDGLIFVRQPQLRYSLPLQKNLTLHLAVENPETASATVGATTLVENGEDHAPDTTARLEYASSFGLIDFSGMVRQLRIDNAKAGAAHIVDDQLGWGVSTAGKIFLNAKHTTDLRFEATYGDGLGRYLGLNFSPDAVLMANGKLGRVSNLGMFGAAHVALTDKWRVNVIGSYQQVYYAANIDRSAAGIASYNRQAWSVAGNLFYSPLRNVDLGVEYRHGTRELVNGLNGAVDRLDFAAKYGF